MQAVIESQQGALKQSHAQSLWRDMLRIRRFEEKRD
jgi:hypothetical protein